MEKKEDAAPSGSLNFNRAEICQPKREVSSTGQRSESVSRSDSQDTEPSSPGVPNTATEDDDDDNEKTVSPRASSTAIPKEISAPYDVPHYPIEVEEQRKMRLSEKSFKDVTDSEKSVVDSPTQDDRKSVPSKPTSPSLTMPKPEYQRVHIEPGDDSGVMPEDLIKASKQLKRALKMREKYMDGCHQSFPSLTRRYIHPNQSKTTLNIPFAHYEVETPSIESPWDVPIPHDCNYILSMEKGVVQVYPSEEDRKKNNKCDFPFHKFQTFLEDLLYMCAIITDGPLKSFCYRRLSYLSSKFQLHVLLNEIRELAAQRAVAHRDFYNVRKVDTHVHAASCMNQKHLLRFMKKTLKCHKNDVVCLDDDKKPMTLAEVFDSLNVTSYDLSVDMLDVHADRNTFHRFDKFNAKYNPIGESRLREIFLKSDNYVNGLYFARILKV